jgi:HSP20 family protein
MWAISTRRPSDQYVGLNRLVNDNFSTWPFRPGTGANPFPGTLPDVEVAEDEQAVRLTAEIPGYKPEKVKLSLENRVLTMTGEKANGTFRRSFTVPNGIDLDRIEAGVEHGVLTLTLPKAEKAKPREIPLKTG